MAEPQMVDPHAVVMTGENSFIRLSNDGGKTIADRVSHWRGRWWAAAPGHAGDPPRGRLARENPVPPPVDRGGQADRGPREPRGGAVVARRPGTRGRRSSC